MDYKLNFQKSIDSWDEGIPLGNGDLGCLIWDTSDHLRFSIDKGGIWDCSNSPEDQENFNYAYMKKLVHERRQDEIDDLFNDCYDNPTPTKLPTGKIILDLGVKENVESSLDLFRAEASLKIGDLTVKSFLHAEENYGMIWVSKQDISVRVEHPAFGSKKNHVGRAFRQVLQTLQAVGYEDAVCKTETEGEITYQYFIQPTNDNCYGIVLAQKKTENGTLIAYTADMEPNGLFVEPCKAVLKQALELGYEKAIVTHLEWWKGYWGVSRISIPDPLLEKEWYLNNYFLAGCSRKGHFPMPLQGVWTADNGSFPPWKGDYHHDLNTQMCYTSYLKANHIPEGESFIDYLLSLSETAEKFSKNFYGVEGLCLPSIMDIKGRALGGWCQYTLAPANHLWLCDVMARHYFYTRDRKLLETGIYPYMEKTGTFLLNILEEKDGKYKLPLSASPEVHNQSLEAWMTPNSNYDLTLMIAFCQDMVYLSEEMNLPEKAAEWKKHLSKLDDIAVDENGVLKLSPDEMLTESHRHHAQCMGIYPLRLLNYRDPHDRKIVDATIKNLEELGFAHWVGYSLGWMAEFYIVQGNGDTAADLLRAFFRYFCTDNGFHSNGDYRRKTTCAQDCRLFTLEGNFIAADAIQEMLLYSERDGMKLFPALPKDWKDAEFAGFLAFGGILVSAKLENGRIVRLELEAREDTAVKMIPNDRYETAFALPAEVTLKKGVKTVFSE